MITPVKARKASVALFEADTIEDLQAELEAWFQAAGEAELVDMQFQLDDGTYAVLILYVL